MIVLIQAGVDVNQASRHGVTPLRMAVYSGHREIVQMMEEHTSRLQTVI